MGFLKRRRWSPEGSSMEKAQEVLSSILLGKHGARLWLKYFLNQPSKQYFWSPELFFHLISPFHDPVYVPSFVPLGLCFLFFLIPADPCLRTFYTN